MSDLQPRIINFTADPISVTPGGPVTLSWEVTNSTNITINNNVGNVSGTTSVVVNPSRDTSYTLTVTDNFGASDSAFVTVGVTQAGGLPVILSFTSDGPGTTLSWETRGATTLSIDKIGTVTGTSVKISGVTDTTEYTLTASNETGDTSAVTTVTFSESKEVPAGTLTAPDLNDGNSEDSQGEPFKESTHNPAYDFFFSETFQQLPKLRLAPDLLVYLNRTRTLRTWVGDTFDLNDWLVSANGGSGMDRQHMCTLTFYIPRHLETYFVGLGGRFVIRPFHEVEVYAKGRFLVDGKDSFVTNDAELYGSSLDPSDPDIATARYYRIYWGFVSSITSEWMEGDYQYTVQCAPMLKLFELTHIRNNSTTLNTSGVANLNGFSGPGWQGNPLQIILATFNEFVSVVQEFNVTNEIVKSDIVPVLNGTQPEVNQNFSKLANRSLMIWQNRLDDIKKRTTFYGLQMRDAHGVEIKGKVNFWDLLDASDKKTGENRFTVGQHSSTPPILNVQSNVVGGLPITGSLKSNELDYSISLQDYVFAHFQPYFVTASPSLFHFDENKKRLDLLVEMSDLIGYEFFQDINGNLIFKPPFYNMDTRSDAVFNINDVDILSEQLIEDESGIKVTNMMVFGQISSLLSGQSKESRVSAQWADLRNLAKYGQRFKQLDLPMLTQPHQCFAYAIMLTAKENRFSNQINIQIPARPELLLGFPVYLQGRDCFGYLERVQWSYTAGTDFTFQLSLSTIRRRIYINKQRLRELKQRGTNQVAPQNSTDQPATSKAASPVDDVAKTPVAAASQLPSYMTDSDPHVSLMHLAYSFANVSRGDMSGLVENIVANASPGVSLEKNNWCVAFVRYSLNAVGVKHSYPRGNPPRFNGAGVLGTFDDMQVGWIVVYKHVANDGGGHVGIVVSKSTDGTNTFESIEGSLHDKNGNPAVMKVKRTDGQTVNNYMTVYGYLDPYSSSASNVADPLKFAPKFRPSAVDGRWTIVLGQDTSNITRRSAQARNIQDMVPLPNSVLQTYLAPSPQSVESAMAESKASANSAQNSDKKSAEQLLSDTKTAQAEVDAAQAKLDAAKDALKPMEITQDFIERILDLWQSHVSSGTIYDGVYSWLNLDVKEISDPVSGRTMSIFQYITTVIPGMESFTGHTDMVLNLQRLQARSDSASASFASANSSFFTLTSGPKAVAEAAYQDLHMATLSALQWQASDTLSLKEGAVAYTATLSSYLQEVDNANIELMTAKNKLGPLNQNASDATSPQEGGSAELGQSTKLGANEVDDILDSDPDNQIFAFGQDTFRSAASKFEADPKDMKRVADRQPGVNSAGFFRPNTFNPYKIALDDRMLSPLSNYLTTELKEAATIASQTPTNPGSDTTSDVKNVSDVESQIAAANSAGGSASALQITALSNKASAQNLIAQATPIVKTNTTKLNALIKKYTPEVRAAWATTNGVNDAENDRAAAWDIVFNGDDTVENMGPIVNGMTEKKELYLAKVSPQTIAAFKKDGSHDPMLAYLQLILSETTWISSAWDDYSTYTQNIDAAQKILTSAQQTLKEASEQVVNCQAVISSSNRRSAALSKGTTGNTALPSGVKPMTPAEYLASLCIKQPYTDANGFEQVAGFPWGRSVDVNAAATSLRMSAVAKQFSDMLPVVAATPTSSMVNLSGLPYAPDQTMVTDTLDENAKALQSMVANPSPKVDTPVSNAQYDRVKD